MTKFQHLTRAILSRPWAIDPESVAWAAIVDVLAIRASGETLTDAEIEARIQAASNGPRGGAARTRNVAVIPVYGVISPRQSMMARTSGGTTAESIRDEFRAALRDEEVYGIVFDVDSPGGVVEGIDELAAEIRDARGVKPVAAVANHLSASAAYWAMAGADELVATPSASVGSIGIFTAHQDVSAAMEREGVTTTLISAGKYKVERSQYAPLAEEARAAVQAEVDGWYETMTASIAKSRGTTAAKVVSGYGEGRVLRAKDALAAGMIDRIGSLEDTIRRVATGKVGAGSRVAAIGTPYVVGVELPDGEIWTPNASGLTAVTTEPPAGEAGAASFAARLSTVAEEVRAIQGEAQKRAELRAEDGRTLSADTREKLLFLADSLRGLAETEPKREEEPEPEPDTAPEPVSGRGLVLQLYEAATAGGYLIPTT